MTCTSGNLSAPPHPPKWTQAEADFLDQMAGNIPWPRLPQRYNSWAISAGMPKRSAFSIKAKLCRMSVSARSVGDTVTTALIAGILGVPTDSVRKWCHSQLLPATRCGRWWYVRRRDLVAFARRRPDLFRRFPVPRLVMLLEDRQLAETIAASNGRIRGIGRRTVAVETGKVYPSSSAAARAVGVHPDRLRRSIQVGCAVGGYHWRWYDQQATPPPKNG